MRPDDRGQRKAGRIWQWEPESLMFYVYIMEYKKWGLSLKLFSSPSASLVEGLTLN